MGKVKIGKTIYYSDTVTVYSDRVCLDGREIYLYDSDVVQITGEETYIDRLQLRDVQNALVVGSVRDVHCKSLLVYGRTMGCRYNGSRFTGDTARHYYTTVRKVYTAGIKPKVRAKVHLSGEFSSVYFVIAGSNSLPREVYIKGRFGYISSYGDVIVKGSVDRGVCSENLYFSRE